MSRTKKVLNFYGNTRPQIVKSILTKKNGAWGITLSDLRLYYKVTVVKTIHYWHKNRNTGQLNRIQGTEINPCKYVQLIFNKGAKNTQWRKDSLFSKCAHWIFIYKRMKLDSYLTPLTKISTQWIKVLNKRIETTKR